MTPQGGNMTTASRPDPWENPDPSRFHFVAVPEDDRWRIMPFGRTKQCRWTDAGQRCPNNAVAEINRTQGSGRAMWWAYCGEHLYSRWVEDFRVMTWKLVPNAD